MRKMLIILVTIVITAMNINSYGEIDSTSLLDAKLMAQDQKEIKLKKSINWTLGSTIFKLINFAEIMLISELGRRRITN